MLINSFASSFCLPGTLFREAFLKSGFAATFRKRGKRLLAAVVLLAGINGGPFAAPAGYSQGAGTVDPNFNTNLGLASGVYTVALQPDGKIIAGGIFPGRVVRINPDGTRDASFQTGAGVLPQGFFDQVNVVALDASGRVLVGGHFSSLGGSETGRNLARLSPDGSVDETFQVGQGTAGDRIGQPNTAGTITAIAVQSRDGRLIIGGDFTSYKGVVRGALARINTNGSLDQSFNADAVTVTGKLHSNVTSLAVQSDGKILAGSSSGLVRLNADGSLDATFKPAKVGLGAGFQVKALALQPDGKVLVAGYPTARVLRETFLRLNSTGSLDQDFKEGIGTGSGGNTSVTKALLVEPDGKILVGGEFVHYNGVALNGLAQLNANGAIDSTFRPTSLGQGNFVRSLAYQPDGKLLVVANQYLVRLNANSSADISFSTQQAPGPNGPIEALATQPDGSVLIAGGFEAVDGVARPIIARLKADGSFDPTFAAGLVGMGQSTFGLSCVTLQPDGKILIGGYFNLGGCLNIARLNTDGSLDTTFQPGDALAGGVSAIAVDANNNIVVGGEFSPSTQGTANHLTRLTPNGTVDPTFNAGTAVSGGLNQLGVFTLAILPTGEIVVGGNFTRATGAAADYIVRLLPSGVVDTGFDAGAVTTPFNLGLRAILVQADGRLLVGGDFDSIDGIPRRGIARLNANGRVDKSFNPGAGFGGITPLVASLVMQGDEVIVGGDFSTYGGATAANLVRLQSNGALDPVFAPVPDSSVTAVLLQTDGSLVIGGNFTSVDGQVRNFAARLTANGALDPSFDPGGGVSTVSAIVFQGAEQVLAAGSFSVVGGQAINAIARLNISDGSLDASFVSGFDLADTIQAVAVQPDDGDVLAAALVQDVVSGESVAAGLPASGLPRTQASMHNVVRRLDGVGGAFDQNFNAITDGLAQALSALPGRMTIVGGSFAHINGMPSANLGRLNPDGTLDTTFTGTADGAVRALAVVAGKTLVVGDFANLDGIACRGVGRLNYDGSLDRSFNPGVGPNGSVETVRAQANGQLLIGGDFTSVDGVALGGVARLNADGTLDATFVPALPAGASVKSLDIQPDDGAIVIGGAFADIGMTPRNNVARLLVNGSLDRTFNPGMGTNGQVTVVLLQADLRALIGGAFSSVGGTERNGLARLLGGNH